MTFLSFAGAAASIIGGRIVATKVCFARQKYVLRDKSMFCATKLCLSRQNAILMVPVQRSVRSIPRRLRVRLPANA